MNFICPRCRWEPSETLDALDPYCLRCAKWYGRPRHYDRKGNPLTLRKYMALMEAEGREYQRVALTRVCDGIEVSTVWLGIDHEWGFFDPNAPPLIFETMVFVELDPPREVSFDFMGRFHHYVVDREEGGCWRYSTEEAALAGHDQVVAGLRAQFEVPTL